MNENLFAKGPRKNYHEYARFATGKRSWKRREWKSRNDKVATTYIHIYILVCVCTSWFVQFERDEIHPNISMPNNSPYSVTILNRGERNCRKEVRKYVKRRKSRNEAVIPDKGHRKFSECLCSRGGGNKLELITA